MQWHWPCYHDNIINIPLIATKCVTLLSLHLWFLISVPVTVFSWCLIRASLSSHLCYGFLSWHFRFFWFGTRIITASEKHLHKGTSPWIHMQFFFFVFCINLYCFHVCKHSFSQTWFVSFAHNCDVLLCISLWTLSIWSAWKGTVWRDWAVKIRFVLSSALGKYICLISVHVGKWYH